jgi:hypothetical protein
MRTLDHIRLVIGVNLAMKSETNGPRAWTTPRAPGFVVCQYLTDLQGESIEVLGFGQTVGEALWRRWSALGAGHR